MPARHLGNGGQTFAVDLVEDGVLRHDRAMTDLGVQAVDWGVAVPIAPDGVHQLHRDCDGKTVADIGYTHHTTQWLESVSRATYLLASSPWAGEYRSKIDAYRRRVNEIATILATPKVRAYWVSKVRDTYGNDFTHRTFMRAAAMGMASTLADAPARCPALGRRCHGDRDPRDPQPAAVGSEPRARRLRRALPDVRDVARGAVRRHAAAEECDEAPHGPDDRSGRALDDDPHRPRTGQIRIRGTTRVCVEDQWTTNGPAPWVDPGETIRGFLLWGHLRSEPRLVDLAVLVDSGYKRYGETCPRDYHARPEQKAKRS